MGAKQWTSGKHQATVRADRLGYWGHSPTCLTAERSLSAEPQAFRRALTLLRKTFFLNHFPIFTFTQGSRLAAFTGITEERGWDLQDEHGVSPCALTLPWGWNLTILRVQNRDTLSFLPRHCSCCKGTGAPKVSAQPPTTAPIWSARSDCRVWVEHRMGTGHLALTINLGLGLLGT